MTNASKTGLIVGVVGLIICIFLFFVTDVNSFFLTIGMLYVLFAFLFTVGLFIYYKFKIISVHPEQKKEMRTILTYIGISLVIGIVLSFFGGTTPIPQGNGEVFDNKFQLMSISTILWMSIALLVAAFVLSILPMFKRNKS